MNGLIYDALMLGRNKQVAREEYLVACAEKDAVRFRAEEKNISFSNVVNDVTGIIHLKLVCEGYAEIEVYSEDPQITFDRKVISTGEFRDGIFEFSFTVLAEKLHNGKNFARITFRTPIMQCSVDITVDNSVRIGYTQISSREKIALLERIYIDLRLGNLFQTEWQEKTLEILKEINGSNAQDLFLMLYKANVLISCEQFAEAENLIRFVEEQIQKLPERHWDLICYLYYISSLYEMDDEFTQDMTERVHTVYDMHPDWKILWILFYMDEKISNSPKDIIELIEGEFLIRDCNSPVMYYEAMEALRKEPELITEPSKFVIHTLNFANREDFLNIGTAARFAEAIWHTDDRVLKYSNLEACISILKSAYDRFQSNIILKSLCRVMILADKKDTDHFPYYEKAVRNFLDAKGLYNYYIYSAQATEKFVELPEVVLEFFAGREYELGEYRNYYLACIIRRKDEYKKYYEIALGSMTRAANEALDKGLNDTSLAVIYRELMDIDMLRPGMYARMLEILCTREVVTENPLVVSVLVFHREFNEYSESELKEGRALVRIFTRDAVILFKDTAGNLYYNIDYIVKRFMPKSGYAEKCIESSGITRYMLIGDYLDILRRVKKPEEILKYLYGSFGKGSLRSSYEQEILQDMILQAADGSQDPKASDLLLDFLDFNLEDLTRAKLIEVMIDRQMYKEAYKEISRHGAAKVSDRKVSELVHVLAQITDYEDDDVLEELACRSFLNTDYDPVIFKYMCRRYDGELNVLILMYIAAKANGMEEPEVTERILEKMISNNEFPDEAESIFADYFAKGTDNELKKRFMTAEASDHIYSGNKKAEYIFKYIESTFAAEEKLPDIAAVAYLLFLRSQVTPEKRSLRVAKEQMTDLVRRGVSLEEFKEFRKFFDIPASLENSYTAEKIMAVSEERDPDTLSRSNMFRSAPQIAFTLRQREGLREGREAMKEVAPGIFIRNFTLFFGESVEYTIDEGRKTVVTYNDLRTADDGSRFARLDSMIKKIHGRDQEELAEEAREYQKRSMLMDKLFSNSDING